MLVCFCTGLFDTQMIEDTPGTNNGIYNNFMDLIGPGYALLPPVQTMQVWFLGYNANGVEISMLEHISWTIGDTIVIPT